MAGDPTKAKTFSKCCPSFITTPMLWEEKDVKGLCFALQDRARGASSRGVKRPRSPTEAAKFLISGHSQRWLRYSAGATGPTGRVLLQYAALVSSQGTRYCSNQNAFRIASG